VEAITDRVAIIARGQLQAQGATAELVSRSLQGFEILVKLPAASTPELPASLVDEASRVRRVGDELARTLAADAGVDAWIARAHAAGAKVMEVAPRHETLEELFLRRVASADAAPPAATARDEAAR